MSIKRSVKCLLFMFVLVTFFACGCAKGDVAVNNVSINLGEQTQVALLVDEFFDLSNKVEIYPNYATDKTFSIYSSDEDIVRVVGKQIKAIKEGETMVRVVSNSNQNIEDVITVKVFNTQTKLQTPTNLQYNAQEQSFSFNPVDYAYSYSININDREFNIGNVTTFNLPNYVGKKFDNVLSVKVKANAPTYTHAYVQSDYSENIKVFQTSKIDDVSVRNGILTFSKHEGIVFDVYFNDELYQGNTNINNFDLTNLTSNYAGTNINIYVVAKPSEEISSSFDANVKSYSSYSNTIVVNVIDQPTISVLDSVISWNDIAFVDEYEIYINNRLETTVDENSFNLKTLAYYNNINSLENLDICVKSVFAENSVNLAKTNKDVTNLQLIRLQNPTLNINGNSVEWQAVENAKIYSVEILKNDVSVLNLNTNKTNFDLSNFDAGSYVVMVSSIGSNGTHNYLTSKSSSINFVKNDAAQASISNYVLEVSAISGDNYLINFNVDNNNSYNQTILANSNKIKLDLSTYTFSAGIHTISITQLSDNSTHIDSVKKIVEFTQYEAVNVGINNSIASITRSNTNKNADIYLEISGDNLTRPIKVKADSYTINTTDTSKTYLPAGEYSVVAYVEGNGNTTFSYGTNKTAVKCGKFDFKVLNIPSLSVANSEECKIVVNKVDNAINYTIFNNNNLTIASVNDNYNFSLNSGERKQFKVRANGNGKTILASVCSNYIVVERLATPELTFNADNLSFNVNANNSTNNYSKVNFYFDDLKNEEYSFGSEFAGLQIGENKFKINLQSKGLVSGVEYIDSLFNEIIVKKLSNNLTASIDNSNKLNISNNENAKLMLSFNFDTNEYLATDGVVAGLNYVEQSNKYVITILNANYKAIKPEMANQFGVKVKYLKQTVVTNNVKTYYTNSDWSEIVQLKLNLLNAVSSIYANTDNKLIVENPNSEKLYLDLHIQTNSESLLFKDNGRNQLVCGETTLQYSYSNNKYYVNLYNNNIININGITNGSNFIVKAKLKKTVSNSDVDSSLSGGFNVNYLKSVKFTREDQNLIFTTIDADYNLSKYNLILNNNKIYNLNSFNDIFTYSSNEKTYSVGILDLWNKLKTKTSLTLTSVNSLKIETLNTATSSENILLGSFGENVYVQQAETFEVVSNKQNDKTVVSVNKYASNYAKTYSIKVLSYQDYAEDVDISIVLDVLNFSGSLDVFGYVKANSSYQLGENIVYVFNSVQSNSLTFNKLNKSELTVNNNKIYYKSVSGATNYEVYRKTTNSTFEKVDESVLTRTGNSFMFNNLGETAEFTVAVKAVTTNSLILNANLSEPITVVKLGKSNFNIETGYVKLTLPSGTANLIQKGNVNAELDLNLAGNVYNCSLSNDMSANIYGISWIANTDKFNINSGLIFDYNDNYIEDKNLSVTLKLNGSQDNKFYIYTDQNTNQVKGLFAPTNVKVNKLDNNIEKLSYSNNSKNRLSTTGSLIGVNQYVFKFVHNNTAYYSTDAKLKYYNGTSYTSYGVITSTDIQFPYGYDANNDGDFEDENDAIFNSGEFKICVAAYTDGYAISPYSSEYVFTILDQTTLSIENGELNWTSVPNADKYIVRVKNDSTVNLQKEIVGLSFDFEEFVSYGLFSVTVQAITTNADKLNGKESLPLSIYRLNNASEIRIDNGMLVVKASPYVNSIKIKYNNETLICENPNQEENLNSISSPLTFLNASDVEYYIDLTAEQNMFENASGKIKIQLCGNTGTINAPIVGEIGMVNSKTIEDNTTAIVLGTNINNVSKGVWKFSKNNSLGETVKTKINYNFNNDSLMHNFWLDTVVYRIEIATLNQTGNKNDVIYAVDYDRFISAKNSNTLTTSTSSSTYYELCDGLNGLYAKIICVTNTGNLYFNVYKDNSIDLQNYDNLYYYAVDFNYISYSSEADLKSINLAEGGTFTVKIKTVGGDDSASLNNAYINSYVHELSPFVRFGQAYLSTKSGQLAFASLKVENQISPVYKLTVYQWDGDNKWYVYLFDDKNCSEAEVREYFNLNESDIVEPIVVDDSNYVLYEMGKHFTSGNYRVDARALAGINADDYLLNAKKPETKYTVNILTQTTLSINGGNLTFNLAYVTINGQPQYSYNYELVVEYNNKLYSEKIYASTQDVVIDGAVLTYTLPDKIGGLSIGQGSNYKIKVRALTNEGGIINAKFVDNNNDGEDDYIQFTRANRVTNVKIENGVLQWNGGNLSSEFIIKVSYFDNGYKSIIINSGYIKNGETYTYSFLDGDYPIYGLELNTYITSGVDYNIYVSRKGNNLDIISSNYEELLNVNRLDFVNPADIKTEQGILTWTTVADAVGYRVEFIGASSYVYTINSNTNSLNLTEVKDNGNKQLPAGNYSVKIKVLGSNKINSVEKTSINNIAKLNIVTNVKILGDSITWDSVENANGYRVKFIYNNKDSQFDVTTNSISTPTDVVGKLKIEIMAIANNDTTLLNSDILVVESSSDTPSSVTGLTYNNDLNRFEWKTQSDFLNTDTIRITYNFIEYSKNGNLTSVMKDVTITSEQQGYYENGTYFYPITIMGKYNDFTLRVQRVNSVDSASVTTYKDLCWFSYGAGTSENPYVLDSVQSLRNIKYYPTSIYKLVSDINVDEYNNQPIISTEFKGTISGGNYTISLGTVLLNNATEFALFKSVNGAIIKQLGLQANITNSITSLNEEVKLAIIAVTSNNSTYENVRINSSSITITDNNDVDIDLTNKLYIGGMFAIDTASNVNSCQVEFSLTSNVDSSAFTYIGGVAAYASETNIALQSSIKLTISNAKNEIRYLGGVIGYYLGKTNKTTGVSNSSMELNFENINIYYAGGVFGYARYALAENNTIKGIIKRENITGTIYIGGVAGTFASGKACGNVVEATITFTIQTLSGTQRLGLIIGSLEIYNGVSCELSGNYSALNDKTQLTTNSTLTLGVYGYKDENVVYTKSTN